jgi:hypothetical protein
MLKTETEDNLAFAVTQCSSTSSKLGSVFGLPVRSAIFYLVLFAAAFVVYTKLWSRAPILAPDSYGYMEVAEDLSNFHLDRLHARPPGYPAFLVLTGSGERLTRALFYSSLGLHFIAIWLLAAVLFQLGITGFWLNSFPVLLVLPPYVEFAAYVLTETLTEFLLAVGFSCLVLWFLRRKGEYLLLIAGVAIACSALTRPTYQALAVVIAGFLLLACRGFTQRPLPYRQIIRASLVLVTTSILFIGGFSLVNYLKFNFFGIYTLTGFNISTRTVKFIERLPDEYAAVREALIEARDAELTKRDGDHTARLSYWLAMPDLIRITGLEGPALSHYMLRLNLLLIRKAPLEYLEEVFASFSSYWLPSSTQLANGGSRTLQFVWAILQLCIVAVFALQAMVIFGLTVFTFSRRLPWRKSVSESRFDLPEGCLFAYALAVTIVLYGAVLTAAVEIGEPRYRVPTEPLLVFMCFLGAYLRRHLSFRTEDANLQ